MTDDEIKTAAAGITLDQQIAAVRAELALRKIPPARLPIRGGFELVIEDRDIWQFTYFNWSVRPHRNTAYLYRRESGRALHLHREIIGAPVGMLVDHINGNGLDVRRTNLRLATTGQNNRNRRASLDKKTGFLGVSFHPLSGLHRARVYTGRHEYCSYHATPMEAAIARDALAREHHGEFACLNFPVDLIDKEIAEMDAVLTSLLLVRSSAAP